MHACMHTVNCLDDTFIRIYSNIYWHFDMRAPLITITVVSRIYRLTGAGSSWSHVKDNIILADMLHVIQFLLTVRRSAV